MPFTVKFAANMIDKLLEGEGGVLGDILESKIESMGQDLVSGLVGSPFAAAQRVTRAVQTGGQSEFDKARDDFLRGLRPRPLPHQGLIRKLGAIFKTRSARFRSRGFHARTGSWQASSWASSREDWLSNAWMHDWRSQPRDVLGRWEPGRLDYIATRLQYRGRKKGRTVLRRRKLRKMRRLATKRELRRLLKSNKDAT